jgi:hypothetical protein
MSPTGPAAMSPSASARPRQRAGRTVARRPGSPAPRPDSPALRLVQEEMPRELPDEGDAPCILIVAAGARKRALVQRELAGALAPETRFAQAGNVWEVLQQAPRSGVVMLAGDLPDIGARTLMGLLGRRQPWLPVVVMDAPEEQAGSTRTPARAEA